MEKVKLTVQELVNFVIQNWKTITGLPKKAMHNEGEFPQSVIDLIEFNEIDYDEFCEEWNLTHS